MGGEEPTRARYGDSSDEELADAIDQLHGLVLAGHRLISELVGEMGRRQAWAIDGARSMADWLVARRGLASGRARTWVEMAEALPGLPALGEALGEGRISWDQLVPAVALARFDAERAGAGGAGGPAQASPGGHSPEGPPAGEETRPPALLEPGEALEAAGVAWAASAPGHSAATLTRLLRLAGRPTDEDSEAAHGRRVLRWWWDGTDRLGLAGRLPADQGAVVVAAIGREVALSGPDPETGCYEPPGARAADALVALASARIAVDAEADRAMVVVHVDAALVGGGGGAAQLEAGVPLAPGVAERLLCDARLQVCAEDSEGRTVGVGRTTRAVPAWLLRCLRRRDGGCRFPGYGARRFTDAHHLRHWGKGGPTDLSNLAILCRAHHRVVHQRGWRMEGDPDGELSFVAPSGRVFPAAPAPLREEVAARVLGGTLPGVELARGSPSGGRRRA